MKRLGNVYPKVYEMDNLVKAHARAQMGKKWYPEVKKINDNSEYYLEKLQEMLINKTFTTSKYVYFTITDKGKERELAKLPYYPDRIVQWAIMIQLEEMFMRNFIFHTYAAIPNKGPHLAVKQIRKAMRNDLAGTKYCLKLDIKKYFKSIDKEILKQKLRTKIKDEDMLWLLDDIVDSSKAGVPIGNYTSQYFANFYLSGFDHWIKERKGVKYYYRYMDDIVILSHGKQRLRRLLYEIEKYLKEELNLEVKENWQIFETKERGLDFVGYRLFENYTLLRKRTATALKTASKRIGIKEAFRLRDVCTVGSYEGMIKYCNGHNLSKVYIMPIKARMKEQRREERKTNGKAWQGSVQENVLHGYYAQDDRGAS